MIIMTIIIEASKVMLVERGNIAWMEAPAWRESALLGGGASRGRGSGCGAGGVWASAHGRAAHPPQSASADAEWDHHPKDIYRRLYFADLLNHWLPNLRYASVSRCLLPVLVGLFCQLISLFEHVSTLRYASVSRSLLRIHRSLVTRVYPQVGVGVCAESHGRQAYILKSTLSIVTRVVRVLGH
jgi:hypothetical protein